MRTKYFLIDRGSDFNLNTCVEKIVLDDMITRGTVKAFSPITLKAIKERRLYVYKTEHYFRHQREDALIERYNEKYFTATVISMGNRSEGLVKINETGDILPLYACNIKGTKTWYPETACVYYDDGQVVDVQLKVFSGGQIFVNGIPPGHFDAERWNSLDQSRLAFKCDENGEALNGLFAEQKAGAK